MLVRFLFLTEHGSLLFLSVEVGRDGNLKMLRQAGEPGSRSPGILPYYVIITYYIVIIYSSYITNCKYIL